jgi:hypothetical protein
MPKTPFRKLDAAMARKCRALVYRKAEKYGVPPVYITAHVRSKAADDARRETWRYMVRNLGLRRHQIAKMFNRDLRRIRKSVIGA